MRAGCPRSIKNESKYHRHDRKTDGAVWAGAAVEFELERSSYDDSAQYPMHVVRAVADENGEIALTLWINEEALRPSRYICTMPDGCQFRFTLPEGVGDADLAALRESAIEEDSPTQSTLVAFLPAVRNVAQEVVDESLVAVNAAIDAKADQTALDETNTTVDQLIDDVEVLSSRVDTKAEQTALNLTNSTWRRCTSRSKAKPNSSRSTRPMQTSAIWRTVSFRPTRASFLYRTD